MKIGNIEKELEIPAVRSKRQYPWSQMEVGDSVLIEVEKGESIAGLKRKVGHSARYYGEKTGRKFKTLTEHAGNGVRVWRTE